jgi:hypothetical protein
MRHTGSLVIAAVGLTLLAAPVQAAPPGGLAGDVKTAAGEGAPVEQVRHRCYWHRGHLHCPRHRHYRHHYGPGLNFYFGPRRHYHHRHHHHRHHWRRHRHWR